MIGQRARFAVVDVIVGKTAVGGPGQGAGVMARVVGNLEPMEGMVGFVPHHQIKVLIDGEAPEIVVRNLMGGVYFGQHSSVLLSFEDQADLPLRTSDTAKMTIIGNFTSS